MRCGPRGPETFPAIERHWPEDGTSPPIRSALSRFPSVEAGRARANRRRPLGSEPLLDDRVVKRLAPLRFRAAHAAHVQLGLQVDRLHPIGDGT